MNLGRGGRAGEEASEPAPAARRRVLLALVAAGLAAPVAAEFGYRLLRGGAAGPTTQAALVRHDPELGWTYRPGSTARHRTPEFDVAVRIDGRGFRGGGWDLERPARRLLVLGDSYAFGWGVAEEDTFAARIEAAAPDWEVLNAAVSGYGTDQELLTLRRLLRELRPDLVACFFCPNDLFENRSAVVYGKHKPWFELEEGELVLRGRPVPAPWLERTSHLYRALAKLAWERDFRRTRRDSAAEWALATALFDAMREELDPGLPLLLVSEEATLDDYAARRSGIEHLDLRPALAAAPEATRFPVDGHWNAAGHAAVADAVLERLRALLP